MENTQSKQPQNQSQNNQANQPVKPFEKLFPKPIEKPAVSPIVPSPATAPAKAAVPPVPKQPEKPADKQSMIVAWVAGALVVFALLFAGYQARQDESGLAIEKNTKKQTKEDTLEETQIEAGKVAGQTEEKKIEVVNVAAPILAPRLNQEVKTFESEDLGVTFTYVTPYGIATGITASAADDYVIHLSTREEGNKIFVDETNLVRPFPVIEVFEKDEDMTLREAVKAEFRDELKSPNCYVIDMPAKQDYVKVGIYSAGGAQCGPASWGNMKIFFLMNTRVPDKFILVHAALDTVTEADLTGAAWSSGVRILK